MGSEQKMLLRSTINWAEMECVRYIKAHNMFSKQDAIECFVKLMDRYSASVKNPEMSMKFGIAKEVGLSMLDELIFKKEIKDERVLSVGR